MRHLTAVLAWMLFVILLQPVAACTASQAELLEVLETTTDTGERREAAVDLAAMRSEAATRQLFSAAATESTAAQGLAALRDEYVALLNPPEAIGEITESVQESFRATMRCLAIIGDQPSVEALVGVATSPRYVGLGWQADAVDAVASVKSEAASEALLNLASPRSGRDVPQDVCAKAFDVVASRPEVAPRLVEMRTGTSDQALQATLDALLLQMGEPAAAPLAAGLADAEWPVALLIELGAPAAPAVGEALAQGAPAAGERALRVLLTLYAEGTTRDQAALYLVKPEMVPGLIAARADTETGAEYDSSIGLVLKEIGQPAVDELLARLGKEEWVPDMLARMGPTVVKGLATALASKDAAVHQAAFVSMLRVYGDDPKATSPYLVNQESVPELLAALSGDYAGQVGEEVSAVLRSIGAPAAAALLSKTASLLTDDAEWTDPDLARRLYDLLKEFDAQLVIDALAQSVLNDADNRLHTLFLGIKLGTPGSQERLSQVLAERGDKEMAEDFLNAGSEELYNAGKLWAENHGYYIETGPGSHRASWGSF